MCISESSPVPWGNPHQGVEIKICDLGDWYRTWFVNHWTLSTIIAAKARRNLRDELCSHTPVSESPWTAQRGLVKFIRETGPRVQLSATSQHKQQDRVTPVTYMHKNTQSPIHSLLTNGSHIPHKYWSWGGQCIPACIAVMLLFRVRRILQKVPRQYSEGPHCVSKKCFFIKNVLQNSEVWRTYQYYSRHLRFAFLRLILLLCKVCLSKCQLFFFFLIAVPTLK